MVRRFLIVLSVLTVSVAAFAACAGKATVDDHMSEAGLQIAALTVIDGVGFHGIDTALNGTTPKVDAAWLGKVRHAQVAARSVPWPKELHPKAKAFSEAAAKLGDSLEKDDAKGAAAPAKAAHETQHALSNGAWEMLAKNAKVGGIAHSD